MTDRIHALWDELADLGAAQTDAALRHALRVMSEILRAQNAFWVGAVRLGTNLDPVGGWRIRGIHRMEATLQDDRVYQFSRERLENGTSDEITLAQVRGAGMFRTGLLKELASPAFFATRDYDVLYRARNIRDAVFAAFPVNEDAESYYGWYRIGDEREHFSPSDRDLLAYALRPLKWFHRHVMLEQGLIIAKAPLRPVERRIVTLLLTDRTERDIAREIGLTLATTHTYITALFRKFNVSGRAGLTALWLGKPES